MKKFILQFFLSVVVTICSAKEGMYMPQLIKTNLAELQAMGLKLSAEDIYSDSSVSLKDAVVQFGGGCTGELISSKGLLVTNHHCGFSQIQSLSSIEKNYLANGFWAKSMSEEIPCPGLTVTFIKSISDVTGIVLNGIGKEINEDERARLVKARTDSLEKVFTTNKYKVSIRAFSNGNNYFAIKSEVFRDIRLVGTPPEYLGKFGGETDNWVWPKQTADFSLFRIYADSLNQSAAYSEKNIPFSPGKFFPINTAGVTEGDFVFVYGFPGRTNEYAPSPAVETIIDQTNPNRIHLRDIRLDVLRNAMSANDTVKLKYSSKFNTIENAYKKWKGELLGFSRYDIVKIKKALEDSIAELKPIVQSYSDLNGIFKPFSEANDYFLEGLNTIELVSLSSRVKQFLEFVARNDSDKTAVENERKKLLKDLPDFYKNFDQGTDEELFSAVLGTSLDNLVVPFRPEYFTDKKLKNNTRKYVRDLYAKTLLADKIKAEHFITNADKSSLSKFKKDPLYRIATDNKIVSDLIQEKMNALNRQMQALQRGYNLTLIKKGIATYPDANSTLRISYGNVSSIQPRDGIVYKYYTTTDGMLEKLATGNPDFEMKDDFKSIISKRDFGKFTTNDTVRTGFISSLHTTGGNSGSPIINAKGELVGINYDRMWEGVMSDYYYNVNYCRNIAVDVRYMLFIIEQYGKCNRLLEEMKLVN